MDERRGVEEPEVGAAQEARWRGSWRGVEGPGRRVDVEREAECLRKSSVDEDGVGVNDWRGVGDCAECNIGEGFCTISVGIGSAVEESADDELAVLVLSELEVLLGGNVGGGCRTELALELAEEDKLDNANFVADTAGEVCAVVVVRSEDETTEKRVRVSSWRVDVERVIGGTAAGGEEGREGEGEGEERVMGGAAILVAAMDDSEGDVRVLTKRGCTSCNPKWCGASKGGSSVIDERGV